MPAPDSTFSPAPIAGQQTMGTAPASGAGFTPYDGLGDAETIDLFGMLHRSRKLLIQAGLIGLVLGLAAYFVLGPAYLATASILVERKTSASTNQSDVRTFGDRGVHVDLISSSKIVASAVELGELAKLPSLATASDPVDAIVGGLRVKRQSGDDRSAQNVLSISYQSASSADAVAVVDAMVRAYDKYLDDKRNAEMSALENSLAEQDLAFEQSIISLENKISQARDGSPLVFSSAPGTEGTADTANPENPFVGKLQQIERERRATEAERRQTISRKKTILARREAGATDEELESYVAAELAKQQAAANPGAPLAPGLSAASNSSLRDTLNASLLATQLKEKRLLRQFGSGHEKVQAARSEIEAILNSYAAYNLKPPSFTEDGDVEPVKSSVSLYLESLENKLVELDIRLEELDAEATAASIAAREADVYQMRDNREKRKLETLRNRRQLTAEAAAALALNGKQSGFVMEMIGDIKSELAIKRPIKIVGACMMLALGLASMLQYAREISNTSLRTLDDVRRSLPGPLLGSVPSFPEAVDADSVEAEKTGLGTDLRYFHRPGSLAAEAYRSVRTALFHLLPASEEAIGRVVQITSSEAGDGKSTLAGNLGIAMAQSGKSVLVVDADLRKPRVHRLFGVFGGTGMSDVLEGELDWSEAIQSTHVEGLHVLAAGSDTSLPAELLSRPRLSDLVAEAARKYDWILIDTPPLLAVSDPCIVAQHVDGMVMVVRIDKNKREAIQMATEMISNHNLPLTGVVANEAPEESNKYYRTYISDDERPRSQKRPVSRTR